MTIKLGEPIDFTLSNRYYQFNRQYAVRDVFDALVELITNSDDSYHRLYRKGLIREDGGRILLDHCEQRKGQACIVRVHDRAEGMTLDEMKEKLAIVGAKQSQHGDRGFMARGAKDCTSLGKLTVESIKDERYYRCELTPKPQFIPVANEKVTLEIRNALRISRGNGTVVSLELSPEHRLPRFDSLARDLPWHYALRDIISGTSATEVLLRRDLHRDEEKPEVLQRRDLEGQLVVDEAFVVPGYVDARAHVRIWRAANPLEDDRERFRDYGLLIKGERAIHECSLLMPEFEKDLNGRYYFGKLECSFIDQLLDEYDECLQTGSLVPESNPRLLIDPNRQGGLDRAHPFTSALLQIPAERLRALLAKDRAAQEPKDKEISTEQTRSRLDRLGKAASRFLQEQLEELEELTEEDTHRDDESITKLGVAIFPPFVRVAVDEDRTLTCYANASLANGDETHVRIEVDEPGALSVLRAEILLRPHRSKAAVLMGTFQVRGKAVCDAVVISATGTNLPRAESMAQVVGSKFEEHEFVEPLEFERERYRVRVGRQKTLWLYAKYPDLVSEETPVEVVSSDSNSLPIRGRCRLTPVAGTNFARGPVVVLGRRLTQRDVAVEAEVHGRRAPTQLAVIPDKNEGVSIKIELRDEDYGNFRAKWATDEHRPNVLLVSARHESLRRYLGSGPEFEGQSAPHFRILLAEIVAESVCRKSLGLEAKERPWEFRWGDLGKADVIADTVFAALHKRMREFVAEAHTIMLGDRELRKIQRDPEAV